MAYVFRTPRMTVGPDGKKVKATDVKGNVIFHRRWRYQYSDYQGRRRIGTGSDNRSETVKIAVHIQVQQDEIKKGLRAAPKVADEHALRPIRDVSEEYLEAGAANGGLRGKPWGDGHLRHKRSILEWWAEKLALRVLADLDSNAILGRVESALREIRKGGLTSKTCRNRAEALKSFTRWCVRLAYLENDPLKRLTQYDPSPTTLRRPLTADECARLIQAAPEDRALLYMTALASGFRAGELRSLRVADLDTVNNGLHLNENFAKNRRGCFQPLPCGLVDELAAAVAGKGGEDTLFNFRPRDITKYMDLDIGAANIPKRGPGGLVCFHSLRHTFICQLLEHGAGAKEAQDLARHQSLAMTMSQYAVSSLKRRRELAESLGELVLPVREYTTTPQLKTACMESQDDSAGYVAERGGFEPPVPQATQQISSLPP
jgi:integrase